MQKDPSLVVLCPVFGAEFHPPRLCAPFASPPVHSRPISQSREIHMPMPDGRKKRIEPLRGKEEAESHPKQEVPFPPFPSKSDGPAALLILTLFAVRGGGGRGKIKKFRMPPRPPAVCPAVLPPVHISPDKSCIPRSPASVAILLLPPPPLPIVVNSCKKRSRPSLCLYMVVWEETSSAALLSKCRDNGGEKRGVGGRKSLS